MSVFGFSTPAVEQKKPVKPFLRSKSIPNEQEKKIPGNPPQKSYFYKINNHLKM
jgi:hypothetical protein